RPRRRRRLGDVGDGAVRLASRPFDADGATVDALPGQLVAGQVGTDGLPVDTAIGGLEDDLGAIVDGLGVMDGDEQWRSPVGAVLQLARWAEGGEVIVWRDLACLAVLGIVFVDISEDARGIDEPGIVCVGADLRALAPADVVPGLKSDAAARNAHGAPVLLPPVNPVWK